MNEQKTVLKPCPFCGSEAKLDVSPYNSHMIFCQKISCGAFLGPYQTEKSVVTKWNTRGQDETRT